MSGAGPVRVDRDAELAILTIDRQEKLNALDAGVLGALDTAFTSLRDDPTVRGVALTGAGGKAFVAGADLAEIGALDARHLHELGRRGQRLLLSIERFPKPVVAAVGGFALGGGCELALACHLRVASDHARFGLPEVGLGLIPGYGGTVRLARLVGLGHALEIALTADMVDAARALEIGLANAVVPRTELLDRTKEMLRRITRNGPLAVAAALESTYHALDVDMEAALEREASLFGRLADSADMREGVGAFLEKRKPRFTGR